MTGPGGFSNAWDPLGELAVLEPWVTVHLGQVTLFGSQRDGDPGQSPFCALGQLSSSRFPGSTVFSFVKGGRIPLLPP